MSRIREYRFNGDASDALGSGPTMGVVYGPGPVYTTGNKGQAADITPNDGYFSFTMPAGVTALGLTINKDSSETFAVLIGTAGNNVALWGGYVDTARIRWFNGAERFTADQIVQGEWCRIFLAHDGTNSYLYCDGALTAQGADPTGIPSGNYSLGGQQDTENRTFPGRVDEFYVYDDALADQAAATALASSDYAYSSGLLDPSVLKPGMVVDSNTLKPSLVNSNYTSGPGDSSTLKPSLLDGDSLKPSMLDSDGNVKGSLLK